jgi:hypothetical protein
MANRRFQRLQALQKEVKKLHVKISTDGSADVSSISGVGISSVAHAANVYTITLDDKYNDFLGASVISGVAANYSIDSVDVQNKTVAIEASVAQASTEILVELILKNTSVVK